MIVTDPEQVAHALRTSVGLLMRRFRQAPLPGDLTLPERAALSRLDRGGPATASELAKQEQISPQSMGATLGGLEGRGLIERTPDPADGRRVVLALTEEGRNTLNDRRAARTQQLAEILAAEFTPSQMKTLEEAAVLLERLANRI
jgi:DNA-binding MarR family transcriptional regulator